MNGETVALVIWSVAILMLSGLILITAAPVLAALAVAATVPGGILIGEVLWRASRRRP